MIHPIIFNTPVQEISWPAAADVRIFIKRDDLIPYSFGGNKVRIAEAFISDMLKNGKNAMVIYGDLRSNLCRVLANRLADEKLPSIMIATEENEESAETPFNTALIRSFGTEIRFCEKTGIAEAVECAMQDLLARGLHPYYIYGDRTGRGNEGTAASAYAAAWHEITDYEAAAGIHFCRIYTPYGTGSTMGGLISGEIEHGEIKNRVTGISISSRTRRRAEDILKDAVAQRLEKSGTHIPPDFEKWIDLRTEYNCGGYGLYDKSTAGVITEMLLHCGIPMDPTYTAKAFSGMLQDIKEKDLRGCCILFLHTGGLPLFFDYLRSHPKL